MKRRMERLLSLGLVLLSMLSQPFAVYAETVGPGGSVEVIEGGTIDYDAGAGHSTGHIDVLDEENVSNETSESGSQGSTNEAWVDDRSQNEKDLNSAYVNLRDLVSSWRDKCTGETRYMGLSDSGNNISTIQYGVLSKADIEQARQYLNTFKDLESQDDVRDGWQNYYHSFDMREGGNVYAPTSTPSSIGVDTLSKEEMMRLKGEVAEQAGLFGHYDSDSFLLPSMSSPSLSLNTGWNPLLNGGTASDYVNGSPIRTDLIPSGLHNSSPATWYKDIESLYRYLDLEIPESMNGSHGKFQSNAMNDFCSIALIRNYKLQEVVTEVEEIGRPISNDYEIHLFEEDENGNRREIDVLSTNTRLNTIDLSAYPGSKKIIAKTYRKFQMRTYTRASYAEYEYLIDTGTNNILWYSEHSMEGLSQGLTGSNMVQLDLTGGTTDWIPDPDEAEIIIRDLSELTTGHSITERVG